MLCALLLCLSGFSFAEQVDAAAFPECPLRAKDGMLQPILTVSDFRDPAYSNEKSDILRFCVWVETDNDTDFDGLADLVKVFVQLPRAAADEAAANGDYAPIWSGMDYTRPEDNHINCSALIVQGLQDYNVMTVHAEMMVRAFQQAGRTVKLVLHQDGHFPIYGLMVNGEIWDNLLNRWLSYHLYGVENGIVDSMPAVLAQSNLDSLKVQLPVVP